MRTKGLHHITALAVDPQRNIDFYTQALGLRMVKTTVNFDAPDVYHFYYGDREGRPGTIITFFPFVDAAEGRPGAGEAGTISFLVGRGALDEWMPRLAEHGCEMDDPVRLFGARSLAFRDPDGLRLALVEGDHAGAAIRGFDAVRIASKQPDRVEVLLAELLGMEKIGDEAGLRRYAAAGGAVGRHVDIVLDPGAAAARPGGGSVHHIAFRAADRAELDAWRAKATSIGLGVTEVRDRNYFESIYFREPGGVLFEIATDPPGFAVDEPAATMGSTLKLPAQYESRRAELERRLPPIRLPAA